MKPRLVLLYTRDRNFDRVLKEAFFGTRTLVLIVRSLDAVRGMSSDGDANWIWRFWTSNQGFCGMTVVTALNSRHDKLPPLAVSSEAEECSCLFEKHSSLSEQAVLERNTGQSDCKFVSNTDPAGRYLIGAAVTRATTTHPLNR